MRKTFAQMFSNSASKRHNEQDDNSSKLCSSAEWNPIPYELSRARNGKKEKPRKSVISSDDVNETSSLVVGLRKRSEHGHVTASHGEPSARYRPRGDPARRCATTGAFRSGATARAVVACERAAGLVLSRDVVATENIPRLRTRQSTALRCARATWRTCQRL